MQPLWYRTAVVYQVDIARFYDANGDGWGDLRGVTERLEYIRGIGANCIWLMPFYETPYRDGGYDVVDHLTIDPRFGDVADLALLLDKADDLGLRVIIDLVAQHTSIDHPWFRKAREHRDSPYRDYYVWADEPEPTDVRQVFPTVHDSVWTWDEVAGQYYRHTFYDHEPDLNVGHPEVLYHLERVMAFWLRMGVAGFRVDALPYMVERARAVDPSEDGLWLIEHMHEFVALRKPDAVLMGEVDVPVDGYAEYFGDGRRLSMLLDFWGTNHLWLALARNEAGPLAEGLRKRPAPPAHGQYATFLRNHDELDLERLTDAEQEETLAAFAPEEEMRIYDRGVRRCLASMLGDDERRIEMAFALLLSLPGSPVLLYGDEIALDDDLSRPERMAVRLPMDWESVQEQITRPDSLLTKVSELARARVGRRELGHGSCEPLDVGCPSVLCLLHRLDERKLLTVVNLAPEPVEFDVPDSDMRDLVDIVADQDYADRSDVHGRIQLGGHGYRWLQRKGEVFG
ncbi:MULTISPECIES: alpha-amylase family glycosyl hydrolase [Nocardioides]|uniref:Alpha-amylase family glycosyl hydrolase n=1 Tax=Nocardioides vastitatis TaxID=2568655 RepID=A0ABW0ZN89_9ACTN|nr:alpha-amylase family glycosyl hydrolase [Nocardioides sp.]THJ06484.1 glycosidase [Nocardioides sp.]